MSSTPLQPSLALRVSNIVGYAGLIAVNVASGYGVFGAPNEVVSANYPTPITPAGWAFSIWGLIFLSQGAASVYQLMDAGYRTNEWKGLAVHAIGYGWIQGWAFQCIWQILFSKQLAWGMWICFFLLVSAAASFAMTLRSLYEALAKAPTRMPPIIYLLFMMPTAVNTAWLSVASCPGLLIALKPVHLSYQQEELIAVLLACIVASIGCYTALSKKDAAYGLTLTWAFIAVYSKQKTDLIHYTSLVAVSVLVLVSMLALTKKQVKRVTTESSVSNGSLQESLLAADASTQASTGNQS